MKLDERYIRNLNAISVAECLSLQGKRVCVVGCGGLGGYVISALARIGVGALTIADSDCFEETNLNRQIFSHEENLGKPKVEVIASEVRRINSDVKIKALQTRLEEANAYEIISKADCVVDCLDNFKARFWLAHACQEAKLPIIYGAIAGWYGQVCTVFPGDVSFVDIYGSMEDGTEGAKDAEGNLPFTAGIVGDIQSAECVKVLLGKKELLRNKILMIDMLTSTLETMEIT